MSEADSIADDTGSIAEDTGSIAEEPDSIAHMPNVHSHRYWRNRIGILVLRTNSCEGAVNKTPRVDTEEAVVVSVRPLRVLVALSSSAEGLSVEAQVVASFGPHARCIPDQVF